MKILDCCDQGTELDRARPLIYSAASTVCCMWLPHGHVFAGNGATGSSCTVYLSLHSCGCVLCCVKKTYITVCVCVSLTGMGDCASYLNHSFTLFQFGNIQERELPTCTHTDTHIQTHAHTLENITSYVDAINQYMLPDTQILCIRSHWVKISCISNHLSYELLEICFKNQYVTECIVFWAMTI